MRVRTLTPNPPHRCRQACQSVPAVGVRRRRRVYQQSCGAAALLLALWSCGGDAVSASEGAFGETESSSDPTEPVDSSCACGEAAPVPDEACGCPGLECQYRQFFCWGGLARCTEQGVWEHVYPTGTDCPDAVPMQYSPCSGYDSCPYEVDLGCGSVQLEATCTCVDASFLFTYYERPELCDCEVISSTALCRSYAAECTWSEQSQKCEPIAK